MTIRIVDDLVQFTRRFRSALYNPLVPYACAILFVLAITIGVL